ncbi:hypothetical protein [Paracoccus sp. JM45]|uniref:hypothetical protein n=1 Tax=Paracoccus sp. JM45 TaxID=2283626 RepID=UPI000E6C1AEE|nr:hypothetical protein [Paracoccus sp. JM45]RJE81292.1 hypothetical protein DWB67_01140 [Paracoccus sp. JM45]
MTTVYLHVGMPKCASSSLQSFMHKNDELHRSEGLCYPASCRENSGYFSHRPLHKLQPDEVTAAVNLIADEAAEQDCDRILISSEEFMNSLWDKEITGVVIRALNARFGTQNVRIMMLFRNPFPFVESVYAQYLKGGMFRTPDKAFMESDDNGISGFVSNFRQRNGFDFFSYSDFIDRLQSQAPYNPLDLLSIERSDWGGRDIIDVLCERLSVSRGNLAISSNERFSETTLHLLHYSRQKHGFNRTRERRDIVSKLFPAGSRQFSKLIHVHGNLFEQIAKSVDRDRQYFTRKSPEPCNNLFAIPQAYQVQQNQDNELVVPDWYRRLVNRLMEPEVMTQRKAKALQELLESRWADK